MESRLRSYLCALAIAGVVAGCSSGSNGGQVFVLAATSLVDVLEGLRPAFEESEGIELVVSYSGSDARPADRPGRPRGPVHTRGRGTGPVPRRERRGRWRGPAPGIQRAGGCHQDGGPPNRGSPVAFGLSSQVLVHPEVSRIADYAGLENLVEARVLSSAGGAGACPALEWERRGCWRRASPFRLGGIDPPPSYPK